MSSNPIENGIDVEFGPQSASSTQSLGVRRKSVALNKENKRRLRLGLGIFCFVLLVACIALVIFLVLEIRKEKKTATCKETSEASAECNSGGCMQAASALRQNMNESIDPCEDFFQYSCGNWITNNPILPSENRISTFGNLYKRNSEKLLLLLMKTGDNLPTSHAVQKVKAYFKSCMKEDESDDAVTQILTKFITRFGSWPLGGNATWNESIWSIFETSQKMNREISGTPLFYLGISVDPRNSWKFVLETRLAYLEFMTKVGKLLGGGNTTRKQMEDVMKFEGKLAKIIPPKSEIRANYHQAMNLTTLEHKAPGIGFTWLEYLNGVMKHFNISLNGSDRVLVPSVEYLKNLSIVINGTEKRTLSNYMMWTFVRSVIPYLSRNFREAYLDFQKATQGKKQAKPRWLSCVEDMNSYTHGLTFAMGYMWIQSAFDVKMIPLIEEMMRGISVAFRDETPNYDWVDEQTRKKILQKEKAMKFKVGFPELCGNETLLNNYYESLNISGDYLTNALAVTSWRRKMWLVGPQLVNAFYLPSRNEINILAGILQPPFYYGRKAPRAVNYGAIGMILGHELSHGFDANGRVFNKDGELIDNLWTNYTTQGFEKRAQCMEEQYSKYSVDGGELGQIEGYKDWVKKNGKEMLLPGLNKTNEQLFFLSFAQMWCSSYTPAAAYMLAKTDSHTLAKYRVIGTLSNIKEFSEAFKCKVGSRMNPEKKCHVW
ncbi:Endothelin-converting enzyme 1 [Acropora cervicornis]|uniref:Endothelin-converting enzyme 1 n=1 Tax=Acropora cervicornis TaxID=6130 RepID=A0AAD9QMK6_ACRCE|nr:Endothelin-converting enzyme 1 [Acropora cervicornis]